MNNKKVGIIALLLIVASLWVWRYSSLNSYYETISDQKTVIYQCGVFVPFENDYIDKDMVANGYLLRVDKFEIVEYEDYIKTVSFEVDSKYASPDRLALVHITLRNDNSEAVGIMLTELMLHGFDMYEGMNRSMLVALNPILDGNLGIQLQTESECSLVLPYNMYSYIYSSKVWNNIDEYNFFLRITAFPIAKDIQLN